MLDLFKTILGMKVWMIVAIFGGGALLFSLIKNAITGSFSVAKLASGFNPFTGSIQGKLIWLAIWCFIFFTAYQFILRPTYSYDTDYKNQIHHNDRVAVDQRVGAGCIPTKILFGLIQIGCNSKSIQQNTNCNCIKNEK